jgi:hypothetical protein
MTYFIEDNQYFLKLEIEYYHPESNMLQIEEIIYSQKEWIWL